MDFVLFIITISELINIVKGLGCDSSYYHCTGYSWCCPYGYYCTGTSLCNANRYSSYSSYSSSYSSSISSSMIGYIVGGCIGGLIILTCIVAVCKSSSKPRREIARPAGRRITLIAASTARPTNGMHPMYGQLSSIFSTQSIADPPPSYNHM